MSRLLFAVAIATGVPLTARKAWLAVRARSLDINVLMLVAAAGAIALGEWSEAAAVVFMFAVAQALEARTLERARTAVRALMDLTPAEAVVSDADGQRKVLVDQVAIGSVIIVRPGEKVPLDGEVLAGSSAVNQAPVTGESLPVDKSAGDEVFAGIDQRPRRARGARHAAPPRHDAGAHHPPRRAGAGAARPDADIRGAVRAPLHAGRHSAGDRDGGGSAAAVRRRLARRGSTGRSFCSSCHARARS